MIPVVRRLRKKAQDCDLWGGTRGYFQVPELKAEQISSTPWTLKAVLKPYRFNGKEWNLEMFPGSGGLKYNLWPTSGWPSYGASPPKKPSLITKTRKDYLHRHIRGCTITKTKQQQRRNWRGSESELAPVLSKMSSFSTKNHKICKEKSHCFRVCKCWTQWPITMCSKKWNKITYKKLEEIWQFIR